MRSPRIGLYRRGLMKETSDRKILMKWMRIETEDTIYEGADEKNISYDFSSKSDSHYLEGPMIRGEAVCNGCDKQ